MDPMLATAARALRAGDPVNALKCVALRDDALSLALRGIAMAQLGELKKAQGLLRRAARAFAAPDTLARARCVLAEAEVALAARELAWPRRALVHAMQAFAAHDDRANLLHGQLLSARWLVMLGRVSEAERALHEIELDQAPPVLLARAHLLRHELALRRCEALLARQALRGAWAAARRARVPPLLAEVEQAARSFESPVARLITRGSARPASLDDVQAVLASRQVVVDAARRRLCVGDLTVELVRRPVPFALLRALGEAWPLEVSRKELLHRAFGARRVDASHRARLRVEIGRLRTLLRGVGTLLATDAGFVLALPSGQELTVLAPPIEGEGGAVLSLLADGESWSTSSLAMALGLSQRVVQRTLSNLQASGSVRAVGRGRAQRWLTASTCAFATTLLLPAPPLVR